MNVSRIAVLGLALLVVVAPFHAGDESASDQDHCTMCVCSVEIAPATLSGRPILDDLDEAVRSEARAVEDGRFAIFQLRAPPA